ncbi:MAG: lipopolysaccharide biosynthesis protein [Verrucomicrobiales bacterium]|nr:lipopolysaccharide biosynthesis protein [Verrucomicrobiales bacterium]
MNTVSQPSDTSSHRDRSIRLAVITSLVSKLGTIILRLVSIPIAIRLLGIEQFGVYTAITMAVGLIDMLQIGIGPALTRQLSQAVARGDRIKEQTIFVTSILLSSGITLLLASVAAFFLYQTPIPQLFGAEFDSVSEVMYRAAWLGLAIILIEMLCVTFEMARDGYLETRFSNAWGAAGNLFGAGVLLIGIWFYPSIEFLLIAVNGSIALAKLGNTIHLLIQRPYLFPRFSLFRKKLLPSLAKDSIRFSVTYILAAAVEYNIMAFLIGRHAGPEAVGVYNVMITIHFSLAGIVSMITRPYWPALMDAVEREDHPWIVRSSRKLLKAGLGFGVLSGIGLIALGTSVLPLWVGEGLQNVAAGFQIDHGTLAAFAVYFILHLWRHMNQILVLGMGMINQVVCVVIAESLVLVSFTTMILNETANLTMIYLTMATSIALFTGWMLPMIFVSGLRSTKDRPGIEDAEGLDPISKIIN